ncbi:centrosomal protein of 55 kDa [Chelmon rostratus]|uniref:centrosomal protein of 55 kDa n=1 Tax=Chelmon rostratus TaxID=109905 RepID=UPI001BE69316|nr:centrosomal protein of 55 kDa [Chelmon rostratus]
MASSKHKGFNNKKLNSELGVVVRSLRKENACLKKTLVEFSRQHSEHNKLVERFLSLETVRRESCQQQTAKNEKFGPLSEQLSRKEGNLIDDSTSNEQASTNNEVELKDRLIDALEKNKQWLEYDQQREAYVREILARMLWLEKQLNEASQGRSMQHNEDHSDGNERIRQMQEHYETSLQKAKDELEVLREQVDVTQRNLITTQNWFKERQNEVEELTQQLQTETISRKSAAEDHRCSEDEKQQLSNENENLKRRLDEEKRRSANIELQVSLSQEFLLNRHHADQDKITDLERQIKISSQDLVDEKQDCSYLKKQLVRVLKMLQKTKDHVPTQSKRDEPKCNLCEEAHSPSLASRDILTSSPHSSLLNESFLECPSCRAAYPASHYRDLMDHLEICLD